MKAFTYYRYGPAEVMNMEELPVPEPADDEVLVKVVCTTVNRTDCAVRAAKPFISRFWFGLMRPKQNVLGNEYSGKIERIGKNVTQFSPGDEVFGLTGDTMGAHAEFLCVKESSSIAQKPKELSFEEASALGDGGMLAMNYLREIDFSKKVKLLINGSTGAIGNAGLQLAKYMGAELTVTCDTARIPIISAQGPDAMIDYTRVNFEDCGETFDVVFDAVGKSSYHRCKKLLKPNGTYFSTELGRYWENPFLHLLTSKSKGKKCRFPIPDHDQPMIRKFAQLASQGDYKPLIDKVYPLEQIPDAMRYVERGEKTGNVAIRVSY